MRRSMALSGLLLLLPFPAAAAESAGPELLVQGFVRAWNAHDMKAFGNLFAEDADFVNVAGKSTPSATGCRRDPFTWELSGEAEREGTPAGPRRGVMQIVASRQPEGWKIIAAQNTNAMPPRSSHGGRYVVVHKGQKEGVSLSRLRA